MRNRLIIILLAALALGGCKRSATVSEFHVVPEPLFMVQKEGMFVLDDNPRVSLLNVGQNSPTVQYVLKSMRQAHIHPKLVATSDAPELELVLYDTANTELGQEGYLIEVQNSTVRLSANTEQGLLYAYMTFAQMLPPDITRKSYKRVALPVCTILDHPRSEWRALNLDVSRHFFGVKELRRVVDVMAICKMNKLVLHLADDQGWRLAIDRYPTLATVGGWRVDRSGDAWGMAEPPRDDERTTYGGIYSRDEIAELCAYAADRGIEVVPEVNLPGHASALLAALPQIGCDQGGYRVWPGPAPEPEALVCAGNDSALLVLCAILDEVADLFPSQHISLGRIGADPSRWRTCARCQQRIRTLHLDNEERLRRWLVERLAEHIKAKGRVPMATVSDRAEVADGLALMVVTDPVLVDRLARQNRAVVNASAAYCSFNRYQANRRYQPLASWGNLNLAQVYRFDPCPDAWGGRVAEWVKGAQCEMATEYVSTPSELEYMLLPRLLAFAEACWTPAEGKDWARFRLHVDRQKVMLGDKGYTYCLGSFTPEVVCTPVGGGTSNVEINTEVPSTYLFYTTDGSTPTRQSNVYVGPVNLAVGTELKVLSVYNDVERDTIYEFTVK